jgi:hypothetical protein
VRGNDVKLGVNKKQKRMNVLARDSVVIADNEGRFHLMEDFSVTVKINEVQNEGVYSSLTPLMTISARDILVGKHHWVTYLRSATLFISSYIR